MFKVLRYLGAFVLALLLLLAISPYFINLNSYKSQISAKVKALTGRRLNLKGDVSFRVLPRPYLKLSDIEIASLPGTKENALVKVKRLEVVLSVLPLFKGQVQVDEIVLKGPTVSLEKIISGPHRGQGNWEINFPEKKENPALETLESSISQQKEVPSKSISSAKTAPAFKAHIEKIKIKDGVFSYREGREFHEVKDVNLTVKLEDLKGPYEVDLELEAFSQKISLEGKIGAFNFNKTMPVDFTLQAFGKKAHVIGHMDLAKKLLVSDLTLKGKLSSLKSLVPSLKLPQALKEKYTFSSKLNASLTTVRLDEIVFSLSPFQANGALEIDIAHMSGALKLHLMPGDLLVTLNPSPRRPGVFAGHFALKAKKTRDLLQALDVPLKEIPTFVLKAFSLKTDFSYEGKNVALKNINLDVGKAKLKGDFSAKNWEKKGSYAYNLRTSDAAALAQLFDVSLPRNIGPIKLKGAASGAWPSFSLNSDMYATDSTVSLEGNLEFKEKSIKPHMKISAKGKNLSKALARLDVVTSPKILSSFDVRAHLTGDMPQRLKVNMQKARINMHREAINLSGNMDLFLARTKPKVSAKLNLSKIDLDRLMAAFEKKDHALIHVSRHPLKAAKPKQSKWSHEKIDLDFLKKVNGDIEVMVPQLKKGSLVFDSLRTTLRVANGILDVRELTGNLYGGKFTLKARVSSQKGQPITLTAQLKDAQLKNIAPSGASIKVVKGNFSLDTDLTASGKSMYQYISNLAGSMNFRGSNGHISGFNLSRVMNNLKSVRDIGAALRLLDVAFSGGTTDFKSINAVTTISKGIVRVKKFDLDAIKAKVTAKGTVSLPDYKMNLMAHVALDAKGVPPFDVNFYGPLDNPGHTIKAGALKRYLLENVIGGVFENIKSGDGSASSILKGVLGLQRPQKKETQPQKQNQPKRATKAQPNKTQPKKNSPPPLEKAVGDILNNLF